MFKGKKITVMGLGLLGRGVGDVRFLAEEGAELIVTDLKSEEQLKESVWALSEEKIGAAAKNISFVLGEHRLEDFKNRDFILKAAGVPLDSVYIKEAEKNNVPIEMSTSLFASLTAAIVVGVTGTRGKSTVTYALYEVLKKYFESVAPKHQVFLGGNVRGVATLPFLRETKERDIAVLELDSWQLQGFGAKKISPHLGVFTTFYPDHLNYYKNNIDAYFSDKANIFKFQTEKDILIIGEQAKKVLEEYQNKINKEEKKQEEKEARAKKIIAGSSSLPNDWKLKLPGEHNRYNMGLVVEAARALHVPDTVTKEVLEHFESISGRLELVKDFKGIKIYNDTNSTTPQATFAALSALKQTSPIILIMGGADKNLDMSELIKNIPTSTKSVILLSGTGSTRIESELSNVLKKKNILFKKVESLQRAVTEALECTTTGDSILFSPAFASFGMFTNEYDRGEKFNEIIKNLKD